MTNRIQKIDDLDDGKLDIYARLSEVQLLRHNEPKPGLFIAESPKVVTRALNAGYEPLSVLIEEKQIATEGRDILNRCPDIPVYTADSAVLTKLTGFQLTRGLLCAMKRKPLPDVETVIRDAHRIAVLEDVVNPTNVGAIFRSAAALGMDAVLLTPACSDPLYRRASRVSMGTVFQIPWTILPKKSDTADAIARLREAGFQTAAMALSHDTINIDDPTLHTSDKLTIILGTEGEGLKAGTIAACDHTVKIPMAHGVDSLNVAAASAVAFWELTKDSFFGSC